MDAMGKKAVVLLSGGLDSATVLAIAKQAGFGVYASSFDYGQRHAVELEAARKTAAAQGVERHEVLSIALSRLGGSALFGNGPVPEDRREDQMAQSIPATYVPARNTIFLSYALAWAEVLEAQDIFIGANAVDYSGYPDCRPEYLKAFERMANLATKAAVEGKARITIHAPLIAMAKTRIIQKGLALGVDYGLTRSCYNPGVNGAPCGRCDSCLLRKKGFAGAGVPDPVTSILPARGAGNSL